MALLPSCHVWLGSACGAPAVLTELPPQGWAGYAAGDTLGQGSPEPHRVNSLTQPGPSLGKMPLMLGEGPLAESPAQVRPHLGSWGDQSAKGPENKPSVQQQHLPALWGWLTSPQGPH